MSDAPTDRPYPWARFEDEPNPDRIARYKLLKDMADGVARSVQMYIIWALLAFFAQQSGKWPAIVAMHVMGLAIFAYVFATPVLLLLEFRHATGTRQVGVFVCVAIAGPILFWGLGIQALMWSDVIIAEINRLTHSLTAVTAGPG